MALNLDTIADTRNVHKQEHADSPHMNMDKQKQLRERPTDVRKDKHMLVSSTLSGQKGNAIDTTMGM